MFAIVLDLNQAQKKLQPRDAYFLERFKIEYSGKSTVPTPTWYTNRLFNIDLDK